MEKYFALFSNPKVKHRVSIHLYDQACIVDNKMSLLSIVSIEVNTALKSFTVKWQEHMP
jgi:hypothetical protein